jgi:hypothetical protein
MILRYLKRTMNQGIIVPASQSKLDLACFVDADYTGRFGWQEQGEEQNRT